MARYFIKDPDSPKGFAELSYAELVALMGDDTTGNYADQIYRGEITIEDVPEDLREAVQAVVGNKIARWGLYSERNISDAEAINILTGGADE